MKMFNRLKEDKGQGLVEYGLILALVSVVAVGALGGVGDKVTDTFSAVSNVDIESKIAQGYIPIASADDLDSICEGEAKTFGVGTDWEGSYESGLDKRYIQVADIDLSGVSNFIPIGNESNSFSGVYDGGGYIIKNLTVNQTSRYAGLFGRASGASFVNIGLVDINIKGGIYSGGLVGAQRKKSSITNSYAVGTVEGSSNNNGGLVGLQHDSSVLDSYADVNVSGIDKSGGLVGDSSVNSSIMNSYATGDVSGRYNTGGLVGWHNGVSVVTNSYAMGSVKGDELSSGGLVGFLNEGFVKNSGWVNDIDGAGKINGFGGIGGIGSNGSEVDNEGASKAEIKALIKEIGLN